MRRHHRLAAICSLIALALSFAETARASVCEENPAESASHQLHGMPQHSPDPAPPDSSMPECPLGMALRAGCAPTASLPAHFAPEIQAGLTAETFSPFDVVLPHALRTTGIFHPPRF